MFVFASMLALVVSWKASIWERRRRFIFGLLAPNFLLWAKLRRTDEGCLFTFWSDIEIGQQHQQTDEQSQPQTDLLPRVGLGSSINWTSLILFVCVFVAQSVIEILGNALISLNRYS